MKRLIPSILMIWLVSTTFILAGAPHQNVVIPDEVMAALQRHLREPAVTYPLDQQEGHQILEHIDHWVLAQMKGTKSEQLTDREGAWTTTRWTLTRNTAIPLIRKETDGIKPERPFRVFYTRGTDRRDFFRDIWMETDAHLDKETITKEALRFVRDHHFVEETELDRLGMSGTVLSWKVRTRRADRTEEMSKTVLQRVTLTRLFQGKPVINSRQVIAVHPESGELLAYKSLKWTPVLESQSQPVKGLSEHDVLQQIRNAYNFSRPITIRSISRAWYQAADRLVPVLVVEPARTTHTADWSPDHNTLVISLDPTQALDVIPESLARPRQAKPPTAMTMSPSN